MKVLQNMKATFLSAALAIGVGTVGFAMFANAQSAPSVSQSQKDTDKETPDDATKATDNHQDGETNDDGTPTKSPSAN
ncbi:MAG: hypothetical protein JWP06_977 [Candidatus Saccharibacteria bacterium]|nr:hypothetical protein [Candidatus Saccharibacteria bacterium]